MCGIVAYIGPRQASEILIDGLSRLEYRGYDSAGIAVLNDGHTVIHRAEGKLENLKNKVAARPPQGGVGIGHTRWATHGKPSEANAHPHHYGSITVVHNGIIENYAELREALIKKGHKFSSETDSEILAHLVAEELGPRTETFTAFRKALQKVRGSYAVVLLNESEPERVFAARWGSPLVIGFGKHENFIASDVPALLPYTKEVLFLDDGEMICLQASECVVQDARGQKVQRPTRTITWTLAMAEKAGFKHFMLKEIFEQPRALADTIRVYLKASHAAVQIPDLEKLFASKKSVENIDKIYLVACGTSWHAALVARYFLESSFGAVVQVEQASEFRYRRPLIDANTLVVAVSQSGETADTLVAVKNAKKSGAKLVTITNVVDSSLARESDAVLYTHAGPEIGVAATKTFTAQIAALILLALWLGLRKASLPREQAKRVLRELIEVPLKIEEFLKSSERIREIALKFSASADCLFIGRGPQFPIALEGALKLKEISYLHAEGYAAGELKHGPIALIDRGSPVVAIALKDEYYEKMMSNVQEVLSRQASVIALATQGDSEIAKLADETIELPLMNAVVMPLLSAVPLQLLAYYIADHKGHDVDQPRNLAKSVTVE